MVELESSPDLALDLARESLYRFLAAALSDPRGPEWRMVMHPQNQRLLREAIELIRGEAESSSPAPGFGELPHGQLDSTTLLEELAKPEKDLCADYDRVFGLVYLPECPPYETEYHSNSEPFYRSQQMADVGGFYRAFGIELGCHDRERPDYLPLELEFMAFLVMKKRLAAISLEEESVRMDNMGVCEDAQGKFLRDHLAWWLPSFALGLRKKAGQGFYAALARIISAFLPCERQRFEISPPRLPIQASFIERPEEQSGCASCSLLP